MTGADDEWVKAAMTDDTMVVDILVRLHQSPPPPPPPLFSLEWSVRQRRSKSISVSNNPKKPSHRGSPTTPLSWSGATCFSGGSAGAASEESSQPIRLKHATATRSKVTIDGEKITSKRSRKKKTLSELKDEENTLLKERRELKREMAALRMHLESQRTTNENLKRMKIELHPRVVASESTSAAEESVSGQSKHELTACHDIYVGPQLSILNDENADKETDSQFILPDLNIPFDEPISDVMSGRIS